MTRETKIGLLVGLAFIIVIGILLSDHLTTSTEPPQATLASAGNIVRSAITTPGAATNPPITSVAPAPIAPQQAVPTPQDVAKAQPVQPVQVAVGGPAKINTPATLSAQQPSDSSTVASAQATDQSTDNTAKGSEGSTAVAANTPASTNDVAAALRSAAQQHGEELVSVGGSNANQSTTGNAQQAAGKKYVAVEGDTFWKIVARQMGANTKANRDAFLAANPGLKNDPNKIFAGHTYIIPTGVSTSGGATSVALSSNSSSDNTSTPKSPVNTLPAATAGDNWYTIKEGDTLTSIAEEQCGTAQAVSAIVELNKDTLKDPNRIVVNTKIKLPNKPVAEAN